MPTYEYVCEDCGTRFDQLRSMKDADTEICCKNCNSAHTHRAITSCYSQSSGARSTSSGGCGGCAGGSCGSCHH